MTYQRDMQIIVADLVAERDRLRSAIEEAIRILGDSSKEWVQAAIQAERALKNALGPGEGSRDADR